MERDAHHEWAVAEAKANPTPWHTCEPVLTEAFHLLPSRRMSLGELLDRRALIISFEFSRHQDPVLALMRKYAGVPISLADACIVRMSEIMTDPMVLTTDADFRVYRRHGRQVVPSVTPY